MLTSPASRSHWGHCGHSAILGVRGKELPIQRQGLPTALTCVVQREEVTSQSFPITNRFNLNMLPSHFT